MCTITLNNDLNGIELSFESKPKQEIINKIKEQGFRWHNVKKIWYAKQSESRIKFANSLNNDIIAEEQAKQEIKKVQNKNIDLFSLTKWDDKISNVNKNMTTKEITAEARKHLKSRFPFCKLSVTTKHNSIYCNILEAPFEKESAELKAIAKYCYKYINSYKYCTCYDPYGDYGSSYNFFGVYEHNIIDYHYSQTEQTEEIKIIINKFKKQIEIFEQQEKERKEKEYELYLKEQEEKEKEYKLLEQQRQINKKAIEDNIRIKDLAENEKYFVIGSQFAKLNKNNNLDTYKKEVEAGEYYLQNVEITKEIHLNDECLVLFENMLLDDFSFIEGTGGSGTDDNRINSMIDYNNMTEQERKTVEFYSCNCIAVYNNNNILQFVIDAQGYSYARYIGLVDNITIQKKYKQEQILTDAEKEQYIIIADNITNISTEIIENNNISDTWQVDNWNLYKNEFKVKLKQHNIKLNKSIIQQITIKELKIAMYKILKEVDSIQEQFLNADLQQGQKITIFKISDFGMMTTSQLTVDNWQNSKYAQYDDVVKLTFKQQHKKGLYYKYYYGDMLVYNDWLKLPENVLYKITNNNGIICKSSKYSSCDSNQYDDIIAYFENNNIRPIINTYKPLF